MAQGLSRTALDRLLSPLSTAEFLSRYFGKEILHLPGTLERFTGSGEGESTETIQDFALQLQRTLDTPVKILDVPPASLSPYDLLVIQIEGQNSLTTHGDREWNGTLSPGDALYIPRHPERTVTLADARQPCHAIWLTIQNPTGVDLLAWLIDALRKQPSLQATVPRFGDPAGQAAFARELRRAVAHAIASPNLFSEYAQFLADRAPRSPSPTVPEFSDDDFEIVLIAPRALRLRRAGPDTVYFVSANESFVFPAEATQLLHYLEDHSRFPASQFFNTFAEDFSREELTDFLAVMAKAGLVAVRKA